MQRFFKNTEKQSFTYPTIIEERKGSNNNLYWIIGVVVVILAIGAFLFLG